MCRLLRQRCQVINDALSTLRPWSDAACWTTLALLTLGWMRSSHNFFGQLCESVAERKWFWVFKPAAWNSVHKLVLRDSLDSWNFKLFSEDTFAGARPHSWIYQTTQVVSFFFKRSEMAFLGNFIAYGKVAWRHKLIETVLFKFTRIGDKIEPVHILGARNYIVRIEPRVATLISTSNILLFWARFSV